MITCNKFNSIKLKLINQIKTNTNLKIIVYHIMKIKLINL